MGHPIVLMQMYTHSPKSKSGQGLELRMTASAVTKMVAPAIFGGIATAGGVGALFWCYALMLGSGSYLSRRIKAWDDIPG